MHNKRVVKNILTSCLSIMPVAGGHLRLRVDSQFPVIPAQAGIHRAVERASSAWIPACAGMTGKGFSIERRFYPAFEHVKRILNTCLVAFRIGPIAGCKSDRLQLAGRSHARARNALED
jgi:hypothetical protein